MMNRIGGVHLIAVVVGVAVYRAVATVLAVTAAWRCKRALDRGGDAALPLPWGAAGVAPLRTQGPGASGSSTP